MPNLRNGSKGDSNPGSLDCESGVLPLSYRAPPTVGIYCLDIRTLKVNNVPLPSSFPNVPQNDNIAFQLPYYVGIPSGRVAFSFLYGQLPVLFPLYWVCRNLAIGLFYVWLVMWYWHVDQFLKMICQSMFVYTSVKTKLPVRHCNTAEKCN